MCEADPGSTTTVRAGRVPACRRFHLQGSRAVFLLQEVGELLQDRLAVQGHKLLPTYLQRGSEEEAEAEFFNLMSSAAHFLQTILATKPNL